jgi:hypothetical protein
MFDPVKAFLFDCHHQVSIYEKGGGRVPVKGV